MEVHSGDHSETLPRVWLVSVWRKTPPWKPSATSGRGPVSEGFRDDRPLMQGQRERERGREGESERTREREGKQKRSARMPGDPRKGLERSWGAQD